MSAEERRALDDYELNEAVRVMVLEKIVKLYEQTKDKAEQLKLRREYAAVRDPGWRA